MNNLIEKYITKLNIEDINKFAKQNNINLNKNELNILLKIVKNHYQEILKGNDKQILTYLENNLTKENYKKIKDLYNKYKEKYQNYL